MPIGPNTPKYVVKVTYASGRVHQEGQTSDLAEAERFARDAVEDGCRSALVQYAAGGQPVSLWTPQRLPAAGL